MPSREAVLTAGFAAGLALLPAVAGAQDAPVFSPTYAASQGSPYSEIYARTFGASSPPAASGSSGEPAQAPAAPLETSAPPPAAAQSAPAAASNGVVYVIEDNRLLTYQADDYASGGAAVDQAPLPAAETTYIGGAPEVRVPTIADRLYGTPAPAGPAFEAPGLEAVPLDTAAGPIPLTPPAN